jgi:hypothetical protein
MTPRRRSFGDEPAELRTVLRDDLVERVENEGETQDTSQPAERAEEAELREDGHGSARVARDRCAVAQHDPPARAAPLFRNVREQAVRVRVRQGQQSELLAAVEHGDDPRRPATELSAAGVEQNGAEKLGFRPEVHLEVVLPGVVARVDLAPAALAARRREP